MRIKTPALLFSLLFSVPFARAADYVWPGHGTISLTAPEGWTLTARQTGDTRYSFNARPPSGIAAEAQLTVFETPPDHPVRLDQLKERLADMVQPMLPGSVEQQFNPLPLAPRQGQGWFVELTDASLVGQPSIPGNYKMMRNGLIALDDHTLAVVTLQFDDAGNAATAQMLALVSGLQFKPGTKSGQISSVTSSENFEFTVPESRVRLTLPRSGLIQDTDRLGGSTNNPRYFKLSQKAGGLILSGWFEPSFRYKGLKKFWADEAGAWQKQGGPAMQNVTFLKEGNWEIVAYEMDLPGATNSHLRAERVQAGTWIDLHLSVTTPQKPAAAREQLLALLRTVSVAAK